MKIEAVGDDEHWDRFQSGSAIYAKKTAEPQRALKKRKELIYSL